MLCRHDSPSLIIGPNGALFLSRSSQNSSDPDSSGSSKISIRESLFSATVRIVLVLCTTEIFGAIFIQGSLSGQTIARREKIGPFVFYSAVEGLLRFAVVSLAGAVRSCVQSTAQFQYGSAAKEGYEDPSSDICPSFDRYPMSRCCQVVGPPCDSDFYSF